MSLDGISSGFLARELRHALKGQRVDRIYQPDRYGLTFIFRGSRGGQRLYMTANPSAPRLHLSEQRLENPGQAPNFCMMLRKYLIGAELLDIEVPPYERIFKFKFETRDELGDPDFKTIVIEVMGRHSNIMLLNRQDIIHDAIRHVDAEVSSVREVMPARKYILPPGQDKKTPDRILEEAAANDGIVPDFVAGEVKSAPLEKAVLNTVLGFSPLAATAVVEEAGLDPRMHLDQLDDAGVRHLSAALTNLCDRIVAGLDQPTLYYRDGDDMPIDFHAMEFRHMPRREHVASLSAAMDIYYRQRTARRKIAQLRHTLEQDIAKRRKHVLKKMQFHQNDRAEGQKAERYKLYGELLTGQLYAVEPKSDKAEIINYYDPEQKTIEIPLKPELSPSENADRYFRRYRKAVTKQERSEQFLKQDRAELDWLASLQTALDKAEEPEDYDALQAELRATEDRHEHHGDDEPTRHDIQNRLNPGKPGKKSRRAEQQYRRKKHGKKAKVRKEESLPPRTYHPREGYIVWAGRNNLQNDRLTLRKARKSDWWFHAQGIPGTHVIVRTADGREETELPEDLIAFAAQTAAWFSAANTPSHPGAKITVDYCQIRYVRKPKGAKPGHVIYDNFQSVTVTAKKPEGDTHEEE